MVGLACYVTVSTFRGNVEPGLTHSLPVCETDEACRPLVPDGDDTIRPDSRLVAAAQGEDKRNPAVCYKGGIVVNKMHQMCDVTSMAQRLSCASFTS